MSVCDWPDKQIEAQIRFYETMQGDARKVEEFACVIPWAQRCIEELKTILIARGLKHEAEKARKRACRSCSTVPGLGEE